MTVSTFFSDSARMTALYFALNALIMLVLGMLVVRQRVASKVEIGDGASAPLMRIIRAHANNTESVPLPLLMMLLVTLLGGPFWLVHAIGVPLTTGRLLHAIGLSDRKSVV